MRRGGRRLGQRSGRRLGIGGFIGGLAAALVAVCLAPPPAAAAGAPYPPSRVSAGISWDTGSWRGGGAGGDLWPVTTLADGRVLTAWGDGKVLCPTKVSYGTALLGRRPGTSLARTGCGPAGTGRGKIASLLAAGGKVWALVDLENGQYPRSTRAVWSSTNLGRGWTRTAVAFAGGDLRPVSFAAAAGYAYMPAVRAGAIAANEEIFLLRAAAGRLGSKGAYEYFSGTAARPAWSRRRADARPVFVDRNGGADGPELVWDGGLGRFLLTVAHGHAGQVGVFEARHPWGPWATIAYDDRWLNIGRGEFLGLRFPVAWMGANGRSLWAVFSCYGCGGRYDDKLNIMRATLRPAP